MYIANPIFDVVFKRLMEDKHIARFFIETLLEETVEDVTIKPQEFPYIDVERPISIALFRLDFIATIRTTSGEHKKVLIEIQKTRKHIDLMRFRNYLGEQYKRTDEINTPNGSENHPLPIITIYILGFTLPEIESPAIKVSRQYLDLITHTVIERKNYFIERLTHDCFVVQIPRIEGKILNRLEKLLSFFEQNYFIDETGTVKEYRLDINDPDCKRIADMLQYVALDPKGKKELDNEQEAYRVIGFHTHEIKEELEEKLLEKEKEIHEKDKELEKKDKELEKKDKELERKDKEMEDLKKQLDGFKHNKK